jgi:hypothetical protein
METETTTTRVAIVTGGADSLDQVQRYMPSNYQARTVFAQTSGKFLDEGFPQGVYAHVILIVGHDVAGWTMDDYVLPRLASGLIFATEITDGEPF